MEDFLASAFGVLALGVAGELIGIFERIIILLEPLVGIYNHFFLNVLFFSDDLSPYLRQFFLEGPLLVNRNAFNDRFHSIGRDISGFVTLAGLLFSLHLHLLENFLLFSLCFFNTLRFYPPVVFLYTLYLHPSGSFLKCIRWR
jgi:hypothetical protein